MVSKAQQSEIGKFVNKLQFYEQALLTIPASHLPPLGNFQFCLVEIFCSPPDKTKLLVHALRDV